MAGKRPTRPQIRSRRRALNSYLLSTESSYADLAKKFGVKEQTVKNFLGKDVKSVRSSYNSSPGYRKLYNAAAKNNHTSDLRQEAKREGHKYFEMPPAKRTYRPPQVVNMRRRAFTEPRKNKAERAALFARASKMQEYARNVERDYGSVFTRRERLALNFQAESFRKNRPTRLYEFLATNPDEEEIEEYMNDVEEIYNLNETGMEALNARIAGYLGP
jgi:hypothetical protein